MRRRTTESTWDNKWPVWWSAARKMNKTLINWLEIILISFHRMEKIIFLCQKPWVVLNLNALPIYKWILLNVIEIGLGIQGWALLSLVYRFLYSRIIWQMLYFVIWKQSREILYDIFGLITGWFLIGPPLNCVSLQSNSHKALKKVLVRALCIRPPQGHIRAIRAL